MCRTLLIICALLLLNNAISVAQQRTGKLPKPTDEIKNELNQEKGLLYLETNFKKLGRKNILQTLKDCENNCECSWQQNFRNGFKYSINECAEAGFVVTITFKNYSKNEVANLVEELFKEEQNSWNQERTKYSPPLGSAGCLFEIRNNEKGETILEYYCGC